MLRPFLSELKILFTASTTARDYTVPLKSKLSPSRATVKNPNWQEAGGRRQEAVGYVQAQPGS